MKHKTIRLEMDLLEAHLDIKTAKSWHIIEVTNSTEYTPGRYLAKHEVDDLCRSDDWTVTIVTPKPRLKYEITATRY